MKWKMQWKTPILTEPHTGKNPWGKFEIVHSEENAGEKDEELYVNNRIPLNNPHITGVPEE